MAIFVDDGISVDEDEQQKIKAIYSAQTRTIATYTPAAQSQTAMTSELDITLTPPSGTSAVMLNWEIFGEAQNTDGRIGFIVYRDTGSGFSLLANSRDGSSNYYSVICTPAFDGSTGSTPNTTTVSIIDESPSIGSSTTYRIYAANTSNTGSAGFRLNSANATPAARIETGLSTCEGYCI